MDAPGLTTGIINIARHAVSICLLRFKFHATDIETKSFKHQICLFTDLFKFFMPNFDCKLVGTSIKYIFGHTIKLLLQSVCYSKVYNIVPECKNKTNINLDLFKRVTYICLYIRRHLLYTYIILDIGHLDIWTFGHFDITLL